jgi:O-antigen/teichoic acid export membrane protein
MITTTLLNSMNYEVKTLVYFFIGALALLACILLLTAKIGIMSYMVGLSLNFVITAALNLKLLKANCPDVKCGKYTIICMVVCLAACLFGYFLQGILLFCLPIFWRLFVGAIAILLFTFATFYALEMFSVHPIKKLFAK